MDGPGLQRRLDKPGVPPLSRAGRAPHTHARSSAGSAISWGTLQPIQVERLRALACRLLQKRIELWPGLALSDDLLPPLIALLSEQEPREIRHLDALRLG